MHNHVVCVTKVLISGWPSIVPQISYPENPGKITAHTGN